MVEPALILHVVNTGSIPVGPSHGEVSLLIHPWDVLKSGPKARSILRSGLNLEEMAEQSTDIFYHGLFYTPKQPSGDSPIVQTPPYFFHTVEI